MKERPILFSAPMVRAILQVRKTQTRRIVKKWHFAPGCEKTNVNFSGLVASEVSPGFWRLSRPIEGSTWNDRCAAISPYGVPGDRLWVKERWAPVTNAHGVFGRHDRFHMAANPVEEMREKTDYVIFWAEEPNQKKRIQRYGQTTEQRWRSSLFMPRWASRCTVAIDGMKVEHLLDISEADAIAEGLACATKDGQLYKYGVPDADGCPGTDDLGWPWAEWEVDPRKAYFKLWDQINGANAHKLNPWVWAVSFNEVKP